MVRGKSIDDRTRSIIVNLFKNGCSNSEIGKTVNLSRYCVRNIVKLWKTTGSVAVKPRYKRKSKISERELRTLMKIIRENRRASYKQLSVLWSRWSC